MHNGLPPHYSHGGAHKISALYRRAIVDHAEGSERARKDHRSPPSDPKYGTGIQHSESSGVAKKSLWKAGIDNRV
jgi:hypothetical protein